MAGLAPAMRVSFVSIQQGVDARHKTGRNEEYLDRALSFLVSHYGRRAQHDQCGDAEPGLVRPVERNADPDTG